MELPDFGHLRDREFCHSVLFTLVAWFSA